MKGRSRRTEGEGESKIRGEESSLEEAKRRRGGMGRRGERVGGRMCGDESGEEGRSGH